MFRHALILLTGSGVAQLGPLLFAPILSRLYGAEVWGQFQLATAITANVAVVACARYEFALPLAQDEEEARRLRALCLWVVGAVVALVAAAAVAAAWWWGLTWPLAVPCAVAGLALLSLWMMEATRRSASKAMALARVSQYWGCGAVQAGLGVMGMGVWGLLWGPVLAAWAAAAGLWWRLGRPDCRADASERRAVAQAHRDFPLLNTPHAFLGALQDTVSVALMAAWAGPAAAGIWGMTMRLLKAPATLAGGAVSQALYPRLVALGGATPQALRELRRVMAVLLGLGLVLALCTAVLGRHLLPWLLGSGWEAAGPLSSALAVYIGLHFVASPLGVVTLAWQAQAWALRVSLVGQAAFVASLALGLWWRGTAEGAATAASAGMAVYFSWYFWRLLRWPVEEQATIPARPAPVLPSDPSLP